MLEMALPSVGFLVQIVLLILSLIIVYYVYGFLTQTSSIKPTVIVESQISGVATPPTIPSIPMPFEGGDYTASFWIYINSYNVNRTSRKHILSIGGSNFSTLFIGLGAFKNSLVVRTHSRDDSSSTFSANPSGSNNGTIINTSTPNSQNLTDGSLKKSDMDTLLTPMALNDSILNESRVCDINTIDFQRWVQITVVLSGRSIDIYMDGKLSRSCITGSYFKVDPSGISLTLLKAGPSGDSGFDGYLSKIQVANVALNPSDIYQMYTEGP
jgi:hypothetical protein